MSLFKMVKKELDQLTDAPYSDADLKEWLRGQARFLALCYEQYERPYNIRTPISELAHTLTDQMVSAVYDGRITGHPVEFPNTAEWLAVLETIRDALDEIRRDEYSQPPSYEEGLALFGKHLPDLWD